MSHLVYRAGNGHFATDLDELDEVLMPVHFQDIAGGPSFLLGVMDLRSRLLPVVSMSAQLNLGDSPRDYLLSSRILTTVVQGRHLGLLIENVDEIVDFSEAQLQQDIFAEPLHVACSGRVWRHHEQLLYELSLAKIISDQQLKTLRAHIDDLSIEQVAMND